MFKQTPQDVYRDYANRATKSDLLTSLAQRPGRKKDSKSLYLRQSFSSSPSPQLSCPLQRKMPGMQRLVFVHLNWLGRQTWTSVGEKREMNPAPRESASKADSDFNPACNFPHSLTTETEGGGEWKPLGRGELRRG